MQLNIKNMVIIPIKQIENEWNFSIKQPITSWYTVQLKH